MWEWLYNCATACSCELQVQIMKHNWITSYNAHRKKTQPPMKPTQQRTDRPTLSKVTSKDDTSSRVDEPTQDMTNEVVTIADSTSRNIATRHPKHCKTRSRSPHSWSPHCSIWVFFDILVSIRWRSIQKRAKTCSCFLQQLENTVVLWRTFIHLISINKQIHDCNAMYFLPLSIRLVQHPAVDHKITSSNIQEPYITVISCWNMHHSNSQSPVPRQDNFTTNFKYGYQSHYSRRFKIRSSREQKVMEWSC
jgi:hypothetical protein